MDVKLKPFDLEAAKRGEKVIALVYGGNQLAPVIESTWRPDIHGRISVLIQFENGCTEWSVSPFSWLRMAQRTRTVWYGLAKNSLGNIYTMSHSTEKQLQDYMSGDEILAIHSLEVPE